MYYTLKFFYGIYYRLMKIFTSNRTCVLGSILICNNQLKWEVVVAQLVEWSFPTPEIRGSNPVINCIEKAEIVKKKRAGITQ